MRGFFKILVFFVFATCLVVMPVFGRGQSAPKSSAASGGEAQRALALAESGHCKEALPLLKKTIRQATDKDFKKRLALDGLPIGRLESAMPDPPPARTRDAWLWPRRRYFAVWRFILLRSLHQIQVT